MERLQTKNYYDLGQYGYISNSDLSRVKREVAGGFVPKNLKDAYKFGTLADSLITQRHTVNTEFMFVEDEASPGKIITFEEEQIRTAEKMAEVYEADRDIRNMFSGAKTQYIFLSEKFPVTFEGQELFIKSRIKLDLYYKPNNIGGDIKTTSCSSERAFINSIFALDYDRQSAFYMDNAKIDRFVLIGLGKKTNKQGVHPIYKYAIKRGSDAYLSGLAKYQKLVFLHKMMNG